MSGMAIEAIDKYYWLSQWQDYNNLKIFDREFKERVKPRIHFHKQEART